MLAAPHVTAMGWWLCNMAGCRYSVEGLSSLAHAGVPTGTQVAGGGVAGVRRQRPPRVGRRQEREGGQGTRHPCCALCRSSATSPASGRIPTRLSYIALQFLKTECCGDRCQSTSGSWGCATSCRSQTMCSHTLTSSQVGGPACILRHLCLHACQTSAVHCKYCSA